MLKSILNVEGVQGLSKNQQKEINGGMGLELNLQLGCGTPQLTCPPGYCCGRSTSGSGYGCVIPSMFDANCL